MDYILLDDYMKKLFKCIDKNSYNFFVNHYMNIIKYKNSYKVYEQEFDKISHIVTVLFAMDDME